MICAPLSFNDHAIAVMTDANLTVNIRGNLHILKSFVIIAEATLDISTWLQGFRVKIVIFKVLRFRYLSIPKRDLDTKKSTPYIEV